MVSLARSEASISILPEDLDSDPWLLNVVSGTLDLRTVTVKKHEKSDLITKLIPIHYSPNAACPTWEKFLDRIMGGDTDLIKFLQKTGIAGDDERL
jgi:putative DNA primase/helicase